MVDASENRTLHVYGDGTSGTVTDAKTSNTNVELATKRIFREGATYYPSLGVSEIICVDRAVTASELANIAAYVKSRGVV
jgi:hypothetical protein